MSNRICVFGASITRGACDNKMGGWVNRLDVFLQNYNDEFSAYNLGISGDTSEDLLRRFAVECEARKPKVIMIAIGNNDSSIWKSLGGNRVSLEDYENNLKELIKISKKFTNKIIFVGLTQVIEKEVTPVEWDDDISYYNQELEKYNTVLKKVAGGNNLLFISMEGILKDSDFTDGLHPNAEGHEKMFEQVKNFLIENNVLE